MTLEVTKEVLIGIIENKMIVKDIKANTNDEVILKLCDIYIDLAEAIKDNLKD